LEGIDVVKSLLTSDEPTNREIEGLHPAIRYETAKYINDLQDRTGSQFRIPYPSGTRTDAEQDAEYAKGRTAPGNIVTQAPGGKSYHNYGLAYDLVRLMPDGKTPDEHYDMKQIAPVMKEYGLEWGGDWSEKAYDPPHFQRPFGYTPDQLRQMRAPGAIYPTIPGQRNRRLK
jgi:peptidoglycan L-alanyl-D-glutamate endopeptidase CwlK